MICCYFAENTIACLYLFLLHWESLGKVEAIQGVGCLWWSSNQTTPKEKHGALHLMYPVASYMSCPAWMCAHQTL